MGRNPAAAGNDEQPPGAEWPGGWFEERNA